MLIGGRVRIAFLTNLVKKKKRIVFNFGFVGFFTIAGYLQKWFLV